MSIEEEPKVVSSVFIPNNGGPIGILELLGPSDPVECAKLRQRIEEAVAPLLEAERFLRVWAEIGLSDPTVYR